MFQEFKPQPSSQNIGAEETLSSYLPRFERKIWTHQGKQFDQFFDVFVPGQYEDGFIWRCHVLGGDELREAIPFENKPLWKHKVIASNAELLLELFEEFSADERLQMRAVGKKILELGIINPVEELSGDLPELRDRMSRRHHHKWVEQYLKDIEAGNRIDSNHRRAVPFEELSQHEARLFKVQTWANWRVLAKMSEDQYFLIGS